MAAWAPIDAETQTCSVLLQDLKKWAQTLFLRWFPTQSVLIQQKKSGFDHAIVTLKVNTNTALFILLAEEGTVNRMGDGSLSNTDHKMFIGLNREPLFTRFMARITPELLQHQGRYELLDRKGADCELTLLLGYRGSDRSAGFTFIYGSESPGPPREIAELVLYAVELTTPWHEHQKSIPKTSSPSA